MTTEYSAAIQERDAEIYRLHQAGIRHTEIGQKFGLCRESIGVRVRLMKRRLNLIDQAEQFVPEAINEARKFNRQAVSRGYRPMDETWLAGFFSIIVMRAIAQERARLGVEE